MMADTAALPWLRPATVAELADGPGAPRRRAARAGRRRPPRPRRAGRRRGARRGRATTWPAPSSGDADTALQALRRRRSPAPRRWPGAPIPRASARPPPTSARRMDRLRGRVTLLAPADGTYSLASSDAPLVLTVRNDLPFAVRGAARGADPRQPRAVHRRHRRPDAGPRGADDAAGADRRAPVRRLRGDRAADHAGRRPARRAGPAAGASSTAYGPISLLITIGAAALLGLLFLRRLVHFVLRRRRAARAPTRAVRRRAPTALPLAAPTGARCERGPTTDERPRTAAAAARPGRAAARPAAAAAALPRRPAGGRALAAPEDGRPRSPPVAPAGAAPRRRGPDGRAADPAAGRPARRRRPRLPPPLPPLRNRWVPAADDTQVMTSLPPVPQGPVEETDEDVEQREGAPGASGGILRAAGTMAVATLVSRITGLLRTMVLAAALGVGARQRRLQHRQHAAQHRLRAAARRRPHLGRRPAAGARPGAGRATAAPRYAQRLATIAIAGLVVVTVAGHPGRAAADLAVRHHRRPRPGAAGQLAGAHPAGRDRLLRHRRAGPGDPELPRRLRPAGLGAGAQQRRRHRHGAAVHRRQRPRRPRRRSRSRRARSGCSASAPRSASPSRPSSCCRCSARPGSRCARAGGCATPGCARPAPSGSGSSATSRSARSASSSPLRIANAAGREGGLGSLRLRQREPAVPDALRDHRRRAADRAGAPDEPGRLAARRPRRDLGPVAGHPAVGAGPAAGHRAAHRARPDLGVVAFARGNTSVDEAEAIGTALAVGAFGLLPMAVTLLQLRVFYAMKDARTPTLIQLGMVAVRVPLLLLVPGARRARARRRRADARHERHLRRRLGPRGPGAAPAAGFAAHARDARARSRGWPRCPRSPVCWAGLS